uniref:WGS project CBMI000000000 data, contig CS3069_c004825 n=1 Tax=Fusarium clavum TaxID=2594811 RepID=A0A090MEY2_9HYPO|nr:unnamed protein product [Fusarium clavum]
MAHTMARDAAVQREGVKTIGSYIGSSQIALKRSFVKYDVARATKKKRAFQPLGFYYYIATGYTNGSGRQSA